MSTYSVDWSSTGGIPGKTPIALPIKAVNNTSTSLVLTGKGVPNYGEIQQENFIRLLENFASSNPPPNPTVGQLWFDSPNGILYMRADNATVSPSHPRYLSNNTQNTAWVQIWPAITTFAGIHEYSGLATTINRIIGAPSTFGSAAEVADNQYGWGQTDLVPEYDSINQLKSGFSASTFPPQLDNNAWAILLSRLRKALRHIDTQSEAAPVPKLETMPSSVGFIDDGRPSAAGHPIANLYNDLNSSSNPTGRGSLPNYSAGFNGISGVSQLQLQLLWAQTLAAVDMLNANRFKRANASSESSVINSKSRASFSGAVAHTLAVSFPSINAAKAYFNSGGIINFDFALSSPGADALSVSWAAFLNDNSGLVFDSKGIRKGQTYHIIQGQTHSKGFYALTSTLSPIFSKTRFLGHGVDPNALYLARDTGDSLAISAKLESISNGSVLLTFVISFVEADSSYDSIYDGSSTVNGTLTSTQTAVKASNANVNSPVLVFPTLVTATNII